MSLWWSRRNCPDTTPSTWRFRPSSIWRFADQQIDHSGERCLRVRMPTELVMNTTERWMYPCTQQLPHKLSWTGLLYTFSGLKLPFLRSSTTGRALMGWLLTQKKANLHGMYLAELISCARLHSFEGVGPHDHRDAKFGTIKFITSSDLTPDTDHEPNGASKLVWPAQVPVPGWPDPWGRLATSCETPSSGWYGW
ncbi:hypothetical protein BKA67DRAFT_542535 [Truncatella angustata]|uniref:Uncharacterized protein n=1 Tax=Truncatella angustata TaxID=152316 RepID=A0A9P8UA84_9PEZI|nr:uncharacterized protein BKA67DRAFT_542535 [Truncatella angustata]KAH6640007.1 hypothetical protein BKA67DRAFT_542535 [Truncatella angustata]